MKQNTIIFTVLALFLSLTLVTSVQAAEISGADFTYNAVTSTITVKGFISDSSADSAQVTFTNSTGGTITSPCTAVSSGTDGVFTSSTSTAGWIKDIYSVNVKFYTSGACGGSEVTPQAPAGEFDYLAISNLITRVNSLTNGTTYNDSVLVGRINALNATLNSLLASLNASNATLTAQIAALQTQITTLQTQITNINNNITNVNNRITNINSSLTALDAEVTVVESDVATLQTDVNNLELEVTALWSAINNLENEVSTEFFYDESLNTLAVQGYAPNTALSARVAFLGDAENHDICVAVDANANPEFETTLSSVNTWEPTAYYLRAKFYTDAVCGFSCTPGSTTPTTMMTENFASNSDWATWSSNGNGIAYETGDSSHCTNDASDSCINLDGPDSSSTNERTLSKQSNVDLSSCDDGTASFRIGKVAESGDLESDDCAYVSFSNNGGSTYGSLNTIFCNDNPAITYSVAIPDAYLVSNMRVRISKHHFGQSGENAWLDDFSITCDVTAAPVCSDNASAEVQPRAFGGEFNALQLTDLQNQLTALENQFDDLNNSFVNYTEEVDANLTAIWTRIQAINIEIAGLHANDSAQQTQINNLQTRTTSLESRMTSLEARVTRLEFLVAHIADWGTFHDQTNNELTLSGNGAPAGTQWARINVETVDYEGDPLGFFFPRVDRVTVPVASDGTFTNTFDTSEWPQKGMNIYVQYYQSRTCHGFGCIFGIYTYNGLQGTAYNTWYGMVLPEFGFKDAIASQTFEVWNPQEQFSRDFSFRFTAQYSGLYRFKIVTDGSDNGNNVDKTFPGGIADCRFLNEGQTVTILDTIEFSPAEDVYTTHLLGERCLVSGSYESIPFTLRVDDLTKPWPEFGVTTSVIDPDATHYNDGIYWTNSQDVTLQGILGSETEWRANSCELRNYKKHSPEQWQQPLYQEFDEESSYACTWDLDLSQFDAIRNDGTQQYDMSICGTPLGAQVGTCSPVTLGYDTQAPVINELTLNPGVLDSVHGVWNFSAEVTDNGAVSSVEFWLTDKNTSTVCRLGFATNTEGNLWLIQYDTTGECTPDGYYNFSVRAIDFAGNVAEVTIDPLIDNTPPVVQSIDASGFYGENGQFSIVAQVTDNLVGVASATAELQSYTCRNYESTSCTAQWCQNVDQIEEQCHNETTLDTSSSCYISCMDGGNETYCSALCSENTTVCENVTVQVPVCDYNTQCHEIEGQNIQQCVASCQQERGFREESVSCEDQCYNDYCPLEPSIVVQERFDFTNSCTPVCDATFDCTGEDRILDDSEPMSVNLERTSGTLWDGTWTGNASGTALVNGKHYQINVVATDYASNVNTEGNYKETAADLFSMPGYTVTVSTDVATSVNAGTEFNIMGSVISTEDSNAEGSVVLLPWATTPPLLLGIYHDAKSLSAGNDQVITATYTPDSTCPTINYNATTKVNVLAVSGGRGGGSGGGFCTWPEYTLVDGRCIKKDTPNNQPPAPQEQPPASNDQTSGSTGDAQGSGSGNGNGVEQQATPEPVPPETNSGDLATGAVVGANGLSGWWPLIALGVVIAGLLTYFWVKKT